MGKKEELRGGLTGGAESLGPTEFQPKRPGDAGADQGNDASSKADQGVPSETQASAPAIKGEGGKVDESLTLSPDAKSDANFRADKGVPPPEQANAPAKKDRGPAPDGPTPLQPPTPAGFARVGAEEASRAEATGCWRVEYQDKPVMELRAENAAEAWEQYCGILRIKGVAQADAKISPARSPEARAASGELRWHRVHFRDNPSADVLAKDHTEAWAIYKKRHGIIRTENEPRIELLPEQHETGEHPAYRG